MPRGISVDNLLRRCRFIQQIDGVCQCLLHGKQRFRFTFGLLDLGKAICLCSKNSCFLFAFSHQNRGLLFTFRYQNGLTRSRSAFICFSIDS